MVTACRHSDSRNNPRKATLPLRLLHLFGHVQGPAPVITFSGKSSAGEPSRAIIGARNYLLRHNRSDCLAPVAATHWRRNSLVLRLQVAEDFLQCRSRDVDTPTSSVIGRPELGTQASRTGGWPGLEVGPGGPGAGVQRPLQDQRGIWKNCGPRKEWSWTFSIVLV